MNTSIKYILFAAIATVVNIFIQWLSFAVYSGFLALYIAMINGTAAGLIVKYILDKKYIFYFETKNHFHDVKKFIVYTAMGIITTAIFWGTEIAFNALWHYELSKYIGAVVGLSIGYITKYQLDKKFVFV